MPSLDSPPPLLLPTPQISDKHNSIPMAQPKDDIVADLLATSKITPSQAHECLVVNDWNPQNAMLYFHMQAADRAEFIEYSWGYEERGGTTAYSETEQRMLEREYQTADYGTKTVQLSVEGQRCQVNVVTLTQTSSLGLSQRVSRTPNVPPDWQDKNAPSYGNVDQLLDAIHNAGQPVDKPAVWFSIDPRTHATHNYSKVDSAAIEASYQTPGFGQDLHLQIFGNTFRVDVGGKKQWNNTGGYRSIGRRPNEPPEWLEGTAFKALSGEEAKRQYQSALDSIATIDAAVEAVRKNPMDRSAVDALEATHSSSASSVLSVYEEILHHLQDADLQARFHGNGLSDMALFSIPPGSDVPSYFANVSSGESIYRRKVLSVLGLRNMVLKGAAIFRDLQEELFIGNEASYARDKGLPLMRRLTGNTVDLDEVVLRCDEATLKCVNQANAAAGKPQYQNGSAFGNSVQAREIAIDSARSVLEVFIQDLKLTDAQQQRRCVVPPQSGDEVPLATQNNDRAKYPVWHVCLFGNYDAINYFYFNYSTSLKT